MHVLIPKCLIIHPNILNFSLFFDADTETEDTDTKGLYSEGSPGLLGFKKGH